MERSRIPSGLKPPRIITGAVKREVLREVPATSSENIPSSSSAAIAARKARRSKSYCVPATRKRLSCRAKETSSNTTRVGTTNAKPAPPKEPPRMNTITNQLALPNVKIRNNPGLNKPPPPTKTAPKRAAPQEASSSNTTAVSAPKFGKFDLRGKLNYVEGKHKDLIKTYKESKCRLEELEEANINLEQTTKDQAVQLKELTKYKVINQELINQLTAAQEENVHIRQDYEDAKNLCEVLQAKLGLLESTHSNLKNDHADLAALKEQLQQTLDILQTKHANLQQNTELLNESHVKLNQDFLLLQEMCRIEESKVSILTDELKVAKDTIDDYKTTLRSHEDLRRKLHNDVQDLKGNIRVFCRVRPLQSDEEDKLQCNINYLDESSIELKKSRESTIGGRGNLTESRLEFNFDRVFPEQSSQAEVFEDLAQLIQSTLDGYNVCVFAYGQTGSGKTYTMLGNEKNLGMIPRSIDLLFTRINELKKYGWQFEVEVNFLEIYNEIIKDLLSLNSDKPHEIMYNEGKGSVVTNLRTETVETAGQVKKLLMLANRNRAVAATNFNVHSSRSHAVMKISVRGYFEEKEFRGSLNLVDLAGSESAKTSDRMTETKCINKSLSALGTVMLSLYNKDGHVPFRNSKLTYLLQSSLGGNSKTLMFVNISPVEDCYAESVNSLRFASKVKEVKTGCKRNNKYLNKALL